MALSGGGHAVNDNASTGMEERDKKVVAFQWWPDPLSKEDEELRKRAGRLLDSLRRIPPLTTDIKAWENDHEDVFCLFRRGCIDGMTEGMLEAPIYHNRQIEDAWLFLFEMRRRHPNRRKQVVECATSLGASYNWSMVLHGSKKIRASLESLLPAVQKEILEAANALELLAALTPNAPAVASTAPPPTVASTAPPVAVASNGYLPPNDSRGAQEARRPAPTAQEERRAVATPTAESRRTLEERRPSGVWPPNEALSNTWPHEAPSSEFNTTPRIQGDPFSTNPSSTWPGGDMPQRGGPGTEPPPVGQQRHPSRKSVPEMYSRNPFGPGDGSGPQAVSAQPVSPGAHLLSASFGFSPPSRREGRAQTIDPQTLGGEEKKQSFQRRYSTGFTSEPASPQNTREQWHQGPSWAPSSASTPFGKPPAPNPNNPFMPPRARQEERRHTTQANGTYAAYGSSPSTPPQNQTPEQDHSRQEANGAASGDPAAIARSMASRAGAQVSSASRSASQHAQNAMSHARTGSTGSTQNAMSHARTGSTGSKDKNEDPPHGSSPAPVNGSQVRSQATALGQRLGTAVGSAGAKASASTKSGVAALYSKTGSRSGSRVSSPEGRAPRDNPAPAVPASWATPAPHWAMTPPSQQRRGASNGPPPRNAGSERLPDDGGWP